MVFLWNMSRETWCESSKYRATNKYAENIDIEEAVSSFSVAGKINGCAFISKNCAQAHTRTYNLNKMEISGKSQFFKNQTSSDQVSGIEMSAAGDAGKSTYVVLFFSGESLYSIYCSVLHEFNLFSASYKIFLRLVSALWNICMCIVRAYTKHPET